MCLMYKCMGEGGRRDYGIESSGKQSLTIKRISLGAGITCIQGSLLERTGGHRNRVGCIAKKARVEARDLSNSYCNWSDRTRILC